MTRAEHKFDLDAPAARPGKYDRIAENFSEREYNNLDFYMRHRNDLVLNWGPLLQPGDSVLELCCGDGLLACELARAGLRYRGVDFSPGMIARAESRMRERGLAGEFLVAELDGLPPLPRADCVAVFARTFFHYSRDPGAALRRLRTMARRKIIVDFDPRRLPPGQAAGVLRDAGFERVEWRPFLIPQTRRLPAWLLHALVTAESVPLLRGLPLRWKFHGLLKGEC